MNLLGLAMRAGKVSAGSDTVISDLKKRRVKLLIIANDLAENSRQKLEMVAQKVQVLIVDNFSSAEISQAIGKDCKVIGLKDQGFKKAILKQLNKGV